MTDNISMWVMKVQFGKAYINKEEPDNFTVFAILPKRYLDSSHKWVANQSEQKVFKSLVEAVRAINEAEEKPLTLVREARGDATVG